MRDYEQFISALKYRGSLFKIPEISRNPIEPDINKTVKDNNKTVFKPSYIESTSGFVVTKYTITKLIIKSSIKVKDAENYFENMQTLQNIENLNYLYTDERTSMKNMFYQCFALTNLDVSGFDTSKVTDMSYMFDECSNLISLDLSGWNTENVTNMDYMFTNCDNLKSITATQTVKDKILKSYTRLPSGVTWIIK